MKKRDSQGLVFSVLSLADEELAPLDLTVAALKKIVADNPLLSLFEMDNATDEEVTKRKYSRSPSDSIANKKEYQG